MAVSAVVEAADTGGVARLRGGGSRLSSNGGGGD